MSIKAEIIVSSELKIPRSLKGQDRVIATCKKLGAIEYVNPIGGLKLYSNQDFDSEGITLLFQKTCNLQYPQFSHTFVPNLSILDVIMFLGFEDTKSILPNMDRMNAQI